jgi:hypothetical protein
MTLSDAPYRGWTNYETFAVFTSFKNDTKHHQKLMKAVKRINSCRCPKSEKLNDLISALHEIFLKENKVKSSPYRQLIDHAAESINWKEVAASLNVIK